MRLKEFTENQPSNRVVGNNVSPVGSIKPPSKKVVAAKKIKDLLDK